MCVLQSLFVLWMISLAYVASYYTQLPHSKIDVPLSVFQRAINELLELLNERECYLKTDQGTAEFLAKYAAWEEFIRNIPEPESCGFIVYKGRG